MLLKELRLADNDFASIQLSNHTTSGDGFEVSHSLRLHASFVRPLHNCSGKWVFAALFDRSGGEQ